jgi:hypothetical protein
VRRFVVNAGTAKQLLGWAAQWPERRFAIEGANGLGRGTAQALVARGESVADVPSTLAMKVRVLSTGVGVVLAAKLLGHVGAITRFPSASHFASYTGTAPLDASSGHQSRHRLNTEAIGSSTRCCAPWPSAKAVTPGQAGTTTSRKPPKEKHPARPAGP